MSLIYFQFPSTDLKIHTENQPSLALRVPHLDQFCVSSAAADRWDVCMQSDPSLLTSFPVVLSHVLCKIQQADIIISTLVMEQTPPVSL